MSLTEATQRLDAIARELAAIREIQRKLVRDAGWQNPEEHVACGWQGLSEAEREARHEG